MIEPASDGEHRTSAARVQPSSAIAAPTVLKVLLRERNWHSYTVFRRAYGKAATRVDKSMVGACPSATTFKRWIAGRTDAPRAEHCAVLEEMFPGWTVSELFEPYRPPDSDEQPPILLKVLLKQSYLQTYRAFRTAYDEAARRTNSSLVGSYPSERQYYRWISGDMIGLPYPDNCSILEAMFPGYTAEELFSAMKQPAATEGRQWHEDIKSPDRNLPHRSNAGSSRAAMEVDWRSAADLDMKPADFLAQITAQTPVPHHIGWSEVEHIRAITRAVAMSENLRGGGLSTEAGVSQLRWSGRLLEADASNDVRRAMFEAVGNLSSVVAFSAFDIADYGSADHCFQFALWCADQSGSWALRANTLAEMSRKAVYLGDIDEALSLIEFAQVRSDRVSATAQAMMAAIRARLLALLGRHGEARAEVDHADVRFADRDQAADPPWLCYYDEAEHQGSTGRALIPVALATNRLELAVPRLDAAIRLHNEDYPRSRTFSRTRLASLMMVSGDPHEAVPIGRQAVTDAVPLRSKRIVNELHGLARAAERHDAIEDVAGLRHDIAGLALPGT